MRRTLLILVALVALGAAPAASAATVTVAINRVGFTPNPARIETGDTVTWTNSDTRNRQVISRSAGFASPILSPGQTFSFTVKQLGSFAYEETLVEPTRHGRVVVTATAPPPPGTISLAASRTPVIYGGSVLLTGELSTAAAGETVEVLALRFGVTTAAVAISTTTTTAGGEFRTAVRPGIRTVYRVRWKDKTSGAVTINVRPRIGFGIVSVRRGIFTTKATSDRSYARRIVLFQRRARFGEWVTLKRVRLGAFSTARFRAKLPKGVSRLRVLMPPSQAGPGYLAGISATRLVRR